MKQFLASFGAASLVAAGLILLPVPTPAQAASLTDAQIQSILNLVESFGADDSIVKSVEASLRGAAPESSGDGSDNASSTEKSKEKSKLKLEAMLRIGSSGEEVKLLQKILASDPALYPQGLVTGFFGPLTESAVKRLQAKFNLEQVGAVGPETLARINEILSLAGITGDIPSDLLNSRVKIKIEMKDGKGEVKIETKDENGGEDSGSDSGDGGGDKNDDHGGAPATTSPAVSR